MTDNQNDKLKEIESIAELMMSVSNAITGESIQRLGDLLFNDCKIIESEESIK